ncbi:MAG TPA: hypothetical protein VE978_03650 [Chitinophagales bacterium]|nr:hypothetical protein [Chitinophagales bacterium]
MKNSQTCPKCSSKDILRIPGYVGPYGSGNNINIGFFRAPVKISRYVCTSCGFSEEWIDNYQDIEKLKRKYKN